MLKINKTEHNEMVRDSLHKISQMNKVNQWLFDTIRPFLGKRILDAGCGNGNITRYFKDRELIFAVDNDDQILNDIRNNPSIFTNLKVVKYDITDPKFVTVAKNEKIDTIVCINTLEHINDDFIVLKNFNEILPPEGRLILLVPTLRFLFSSLDEAAGHLRRYKKKEIVQKLMTINFSIQYIRYFNLFGVIGWFLHSKVLKRKRFSEKSLNLYEGLARYFIFFERILHNPIGLSLLVVASKTTKI